MSIVIDENIMVPMRDGIKLATDVYRPAQEGQWPVLLTRVPYNKDIRFPVPQLQEKRIFLELNLMEPGRIYELHVDLGATSNVFLAGHRIRLEVSSSNFPRFDRNSNTGGTIASEGENDFEQAINRVYH